MYKDGVARVEQSTSFHHRCKTAFSNSAVGTMSTASRGELVQVTCQREDLS